MRKWTKKDVRTLCGTLSTFWLRHRMYRSADAIRAALDARRAEIVLAGLEELRGLFADRAADYRKTADHYEANPKISSPELIARFRTYAGEAERDATRAAKLIARVQSDGLPQEVQAFDPAAQP